MIHGMQEGEPIILSGLDLRVPEVPGPDSALLPPLSCLPAGGHVTGAWGGALIIITLPLPLPVHSLAFCLWLKIWFLVFPMGLPPLSLWPPRLDP